MTITHEIEREEVMAYLDGELEASRALSVRAHLDQCAECRALSDELRDVSSGLAEWEVEPAPATLVAPAIGPSGHRAVGLLKGFTDRLASSRFRWSLVGATVLGLAVVAVTWDGLARRSSGDRVGGPASILMAPVPALPLPVEGQSGASRVISGGGDAPRALGYANAPANASAAQATANSQMIVRTVSISLSTETFDDMRAALERVAAAHHGSMAALTVVGDPSNRRSMSATLRVPIAELDAALAGVRALGKVLQESQSSEDVTDAHRDLAIRIANAKVEETRLGEILKDRTGRLSDVLAVEQAQSRVRTEIEQMEAQELAMRNRAALSTINVEVGERYRAELADTGPLPIGQRLRNAVVDGARTALESLVGVTLTLLAAAPTLLLWAVLLFLPARWIVRRLRRRPAVT
jgi:anti-sigma factor RsiW